MNTFDMCTALFSTTVLLMLVINVNSMARLNGGEIRSKRQEGQRRLFLRSEKLEYTEGNELQMIITPKEIDVDPRSTYNLKFMALMNSPCRPEYDGFFGATSGDSIRIQYGFQVEVEPLSAIMDILDTIEDRIVDSILQSSFPEMCGLHRARKTQESSETLLELPHVEDSQRSLGHIDGHPSGFRFLKFEEVEKCHPKENEVNFCGIFTGVLYVYGKHQHGEEASRVIMSYINEVLDTSEPHDLHSELASLSSVEKFSVIEGGHANESLISPDQSGGALSRLDMLLIIVSGLIVVAIAYYAYIQWNERRYHGQKDSNKAGNLHSHSDNGNDEFIDEDLNFEPYRDGRGNSGLFK